MNNNVKHVDWEQVETFLDEISVISDLYNLNFTGVYGLPRGGLVLAVMISHRLNIPLLLAPCKNCLIVDDIADTGISLEHYDIDKNEKQYYITTMYYHRQSKVVPDFYVYEKTDNWIKFPWEY
jgi:hypoxanthine phosphoribosyltransferase